MKKIYKTPLITIISMETASILMSSSGADATLPDGGFTPIQTGKRTSIFTEEGEEDNIWN